MDIDAGRMIDLSERIPTEDLPTFSEDEDMVTPKGTCLVDVPVSSAMLQAVSMETSALSSAESVEAVLPTSATVVLDNVLTVRSKETKTFRMLKRRSSSASKLRR
jgi:hypothetical protein